MSISTSVPVLSHLARRTSAVCVALALAAGALLIGGATPAAASTSVEQTFLAKMNTARAAAGAPQLTSRTHLVAVAREWARTMAGQARLYHNPALTSDVNNWRWVGENVGYGPDALTVHVAFMNSPGHRANILDRDYTEVGIGAVTVAGRVWVAEVFRRPLRITTSALTTSTGFTHQLTAGSTGPAVSRVQARLGLTATGHYGTPTEAAVSRFQQRQGWAGRGNVGRTTWARLF